MIFEKMTANLTTEQMTIFNRVMKSSFYHPIAAKRHEPKNKYYMDAIEPAISASFYTEYFVALRDDYDEGTDIDEYITSDNLPNFIKKVVQCIERLGPMQKK